jgi:hypothetical protein
MQLPGERTERHTKAKPKTPKWLVVLCVFTLFVSLVATSLSMAALSSVPNQVDTYVQTHKQELKGDKGDTGQTGPRGFTGANGLNGTNSYAPTHCSTYGFGDYASTNCY